MGLVLRPVHRGLCGSEGRFCSERGLVLWHHYVLAYKARSALDQGRWSEAVELTQQILRDPRTMLARIPALVVLALIRGRRGDPDCSSPVDEAFALAEPTGELQHLAPVAAARAELAWLAGQPAIVAPVLPSKQGNGVEGLRERDRGLSRVRSGSAGGCRRSTPAAGPPDHPTTLKTSLW